MDLSHEIIKQNELILVHPVEIIICKLNEIIIIFKTESM